jgi:hypothetical protein
MNEFYDDLLKTIHLAEARGNALADELIASLEAARVHIVGKLAELQAKHLTGAPWDAESLARRKAFLEAQRAEIDRLISEVYANMARLTLEAARDAINFTAAATGRKFAAIGGVNITLGGAAAHSLSTVVAWAEVHTIEGDDTCQGPDRPPAQERHEFSEGGGRSERRRRTHKKGLRLDGHAG